MLKVDTGGSPSSESIFDDLRSMMKDALAQETQNMAKSLMAMVAQEAQSIMAQEAQNMSKNVCEMLKEEITTSRLLLGPAEARKTRVRAKFGIRGQVGDDDPSPDHPSGSENGQVTGRRSTVVHPNLRKPGAGDSRSATVTGSSYGLLLEESTDLDFLDLDGDLDKEGNNMIDTPRESNLLMQAVRRVAEDPRLDVFVGVVILLNAIAIGVETDVMASGWLKDAPKIFEDIDFLFCCIFVTEIALRVSSQGFNFFTKAGNVFDFSLVAMQVFDVGVSIAGVLRMGRLLRLLRLVRVLRLLRVFRLFEELQSVLSCLMQAFKSLVWTGLMLLLVLYILAVYLTQITTDYKIKHKDLLETDAVFVSLERYYGNMGSTMLVLYQMITGGIEWNNCLTPLYSFSSPYHSLVFVAYITLVLFGLLNVATGVFVESLLSATQQVKAESLAKSLRSVVQHADSDHSGYLSYAKLEALHGDPDFRRYLHAIDLNPKQVRDLFNLLDIDSHGTMTCEAFMEGALRLMGTAKAIDLSAFIHGYIIELGLNKDFQTRVEMRLSSISRILHAQEETNFPLPP